MSPDYLLLTPTPLSTTPTIRAAMGRDVSTWAVEYSTVVPCGASLLVAAVDEVSSLMELFSTSPASGSGAGE